MEKVSLVVSSCDKYSSAWKPYFELIKKFWPEHPTTIYLISESKRYNDPDLNIITKNYPSSYTWSQRLWHTLNCIKTEYIIFSLEDAFLLDFVKQKEIDKCLKWMDNNPEIVECRLSSWQAIKLGEKWGNSFKVAGPDVPYRLDTQVAIWRRTDLMSFIDITEDPWQFEGNGTERIKGSNKIFLWHSQTNLYDLTQMIFPYHVHPKEGYGIAWGHWLWKNKKWFKECGIDKVPYWKLGTLSEKNVLLRYKYVYGLIPSNKNKVKIGFYKLFKELKITFHNFTSQGLLKGFETIWVKMMKRLTK